MPPALRARRGHLDRRRGARQPVAAEQAARRRSPRRSRRRWRRPWRRPPSRRTTSPARVVVEAARLAAPPGSARPPRSPACRRRSCRRWPWSRRRAGPARMAATACAAAAIALRPSSGRIPACAARPWNARLEAVVGGRGDDQLADREAWSNTKPNSAAQPPAVERLGAAQRELLARGEQQLQAHRRRLPGRGGGRRPGWWPPRPCCRRPGWPRGGSSAPRAPLHLDRRVQRHGV